MSSRMVLSFVLACLAAFTGVAVADDPAPAPCGATELSDPAGDASVSVIGGPESQQGPDNTDIRDVYFSTVTGSDGKEHTYANMVVTKLDDEAPLLATASQIQYEVEFTTDVLYRLRAYWEDGAYTYKVQTFDPDTGLGSEADATGRVARGPMGVVSIEAPAAVENLAAGAKATAVSALIGYPQPGGLVRSIVDDTETKASMTVGACASATPAATETATASPSTTPSETPAQNPPAGPPAANPAPAGPATLALSVEAGKPSARKVARQRKLGVTLKAGEKIVNFVATLRKGRRTLGAGRLAVIDPGTAKLRVELPRKAAKTLRKGTYSLAFAGTRSDGRRASGSARITLRK